MKQGDEVSTPKGAGVFYEINKEDPTKGFIRLAASTEGRVWRPIIQEGAPILECIPCNEFPLEDIKVTKTFEERQIEERKRAERLHAERLAKRQAAMREWERQQKEMHARGQGQSQT